MPGIYISYRRQDSGAYAGRLFDALSASLPRTRVAMDALALAPGEDFADLIQGLLGDSDVLLVVIGRDWETAKDAEGRRRLDDPRDPIRLEITSALQRDLRIVPVLVGGARMPHEPDLPPGMSSLARRQPWILRDADWARDLDGLLHLLSHLTGVPAQPPAPRAAPGADAALRQGWDRLRRLWRHDTPADGVKIARSGAGDASGADADLDAAGPDTALTPADAEPAMAGAEPPPDAFEPPREAAIPVPETASPAPEPVHLGASAPRAVRPGDEFTARFVAYVAAREAQVRDTLTRLSPGATTHLDLKTCQWQPGTRLSVRLAAKGLEVSPAEEGFVWDGRQAMLEFDVAVPAAAPLGTVVLKFDVLLDGITVARLRLDLQVAAQAAAEPAEAKVDAARTAFASYSSKDRDRVLDRVDAARIAAGLDIFLDCLSLHPGEQWKAALEREIPARDLFMLFWSTAAAESEWVEWEWRRALELKGLEAMQIHPLENGVRPPPELGELHFGSAAMYARRPAGGQG